MRAYLATRYEPGAVRETFEDDVGDVIDCVAFREQPSLRRQGIDPDRGRTPSELDDETSMALLDGEAAARKPARRACPPDTVSFRHYTLDDLRAYGTLVRFLRRNHTGQSLRDVDYTSHEHAQNFYVAKNWGASTTLNVWIPPEIEKGDFSLSQMWVTAGKRPNEPTVEAGWIAYRDEPDGKAVPRLFIYSTSDGYQSTGCYNSLCDRFVKMPTSQIVLDGRFASTSELGGTQRVFTLRWQLCTTSTCGGWAGWWLKYEGGGYSEWVGFYPRSLFDSARLADAADFVSFGGEVYRAAPGAHTATDMGSGRFPDEGYGAAAYNGACA